MRYSKILPKKVAKKWLDTIMGCGIFKVTLTCVDWEKGLWRVTISTDAEHHTESLNVILSALLKLI